MPKKKKQVRAVVPTIYIIEAATPSNGTYYKVGFTDLDNTSRPDGLIKEYRELHPDNKLKLLKTIQLPLLRKSKYFNDNKVRDELTVEHFLDIRTVLPSYIAQIIGVDGKNEFVEVTNPNVSIVDAVQEAIDTLAKDKNNYIYDIKNILVYDDQTHKITGNLITNIENYLGYKIAAQHQGKNLLFIGQLDKEWLATVALTNTVVCLTDDADERPVFSGYQALNDAIIYVNNIEEIKDMNIDFDLVLSNPPYGSTGANITDEIRQHVNYKEFINLLPANDYKRNEAKDLFKYQSDMKCVTKTNTTSADKKFTDAVVTTHMARIHKGTKEDPAPNINMTMDEFERSQYIDRSLDKYFEENSKRSHYAIDAMPACGFTKRNITTPWDVKTTFIIGLRDMNHKHLPYDRDSDTYRWNVDETLTFKDLTPTVSGQLLISNCNFKTPLEKKNFVEFIYSKLGFRFMSKIFIALNCDGTVHSIAFPKVDWTKTWTVETILQELNYTPEEIKVVIDDLNNNPVYKYLKD